MTMRVLALALCMVWMAHAGPIPVIIDTDIGDYFDDSWAIALALSSPALDVRMVVTAAHNTSARAQIVAKYLTAYGRTDIPIGVGKSQDATIGPLYAWAQDTPLSSYAGPVFLDGVAAAADLIRTASANGETLQYLALAPYVNFEALRTRFPQEAGAVRHVTAMGGAIHLCYTGPAPPCHEYNVNEDLDASRAFWGGPWGITLTPLDASQVEMDAPSFAMLADHNTSSHTMVQTLLESSCVWDQYKVCFPGSSKPFCCQHQSFLMYDPITTWMAIDQTGMHVDPLNVTLTQGGQTELIPGQGRPMDVALKWRSGGESSFFSHLAQLLVNYDA